MSQQPTPQTQRQRPELLRMPDVLELIPLSKGSIWRLIREGRFPAPIKLGVRSVAWRMADIQTWLDQRQQREVMA